MEGTVLIFVTRTGQGDDRDIRNDDLKRR